MTSDRISRNRARAQAALEPGRSSFINPEAVIQAVAVARRRMNTIIEDARTYRVESEAKLQTITDRGLRSSVEASAKHLSADSTDVSNPHSEPEN